jgi:pimeloyl-ACP methyl ester carboxylesterase
MMCDQRLWAAQTEVLARDFRVQHASIAGEDSVAAIAARVLQEVPSRFALAGLSMGGIVAFEILRQAPERVERLALLDTTFKADPPHRRRLRDEQIQRVRSGELERVLRDELKPNYLAACHRGNTELLDAVLAMGLRQGEDVFVAQSRALQRRSDSGPTLEKISCPTVVVCGAEDQLCPPEIHEEMAMRIPQASLHVIDSCGHLSSMEQPDVVTGLLRDWMRADLPVQIMPTR